MDVISLIKEHKEEIFNNLSQDHKSLDSYIYISNEFKKRNIVNNKKFKKIYINFYKLNSAGLTRELIDRYFKLLEKRETCFEKILLELSKIPRRNGKPAVLLSFASKLVHTVDNNQPIYDSRVAKILNIKPNYNIREINKRINDRLTVYTVLKKKFNEILNNPEIKKIIKDFKGRLKVNISDVKMLDFILWKLSDIIMKQKIRN